MILWLAPIGAFGAIAGVVSETGLAAVGQLALLMTALYITCILFVFVVLGTILRVFTRVNVFKLFTYLGREFLLIVATSWSESALPHLMAKLEHMGVERSTVGVVVPTGYSFNALSGQIQFDYSAAGMSEPNVRPGTVPFVIDRSADLLSATPYPIIESSPVST